MTVFPSFYTILRVSSRILLVGIAICLPLTTTNGQARKPIDDPSTKDSSTKDAKPTGGVPIEVRFNDSSVMKMTLCEDHIEFITPYGKLDVPSSEIRRIELGLRVPDETSKKIESALLDLGNPQFRRREAASAILLGLREKAYPAVVNATKNSDMEIANRAEELVKKFKEAVPAELLQTRDYDVLHTDRSRIAGRIEGPNLKARTVQFGEVSLRLADVFVLNARGAESDVDATTAIAAPMNLVQLQNDVGKSFTFKITGTNNGSVWGSDIYSTDSALGTAAVHAGLLTVGQTGVLKVTIVPSPPNFVGSSRNGIVSADYGQGYPAAFRMRR